MEASIVMAKLGTRKHPAVVRVQTMERATEIMAICDRHHWQVIAGVEEDQPEDISDVERLLNSPPGSPLLAFTPMVRRNGSCPCGSGRRFKQCCGK